MITSCPVIGLQRCTVAHRVWQAVCSNIQPVIHFVIQQTFQPSTTYIQQNYSAFNQKNSTFNNKNSTFNKKIQRSTIKIQRSTIKIQRSTKTFNVQQKHSAFNKNIQRSTKIFNFNANFQRSKNVQRSTKYSTFNKIFNNQRKKIQPIKIAHFRPQATIFKRMKYGGFD